MHIVSTNEDGPAWLSVISIECVPDSLIGQHDLFGEDGPGTVFGATSQPVHFLNSPSFI